MDIVGIAFDGEMKGYVALKTIKISKWIDPDDHSMEVIFRITVEHIYENGETKKPRNLYVYFREEDFDNILSKESSLGLGKEDQEENLNERRELEEKISPLRGYVPQIPIKNIEKDAIRERKRIKVTFGEYSITEDAKKMNIKFSLKFKKSIDIIKGIKSNSEETLWYYDCLIEPYLVQTLKWCSKEFMPPLDTLEVWLQIPKELYGSISAINVLPVGFFEQMFLLGEEIAQRFQEANQPLAKKDTLCINLSFPNISTSSPPEEIEVTCGMRKFENEERFVRRFKKSPKNSILSLRELLYMCKVRTLDFIYIISGISDKNLKMVLEIFNIMVFQRYLRSIEKNLGCLLQVLDHFRDFPHGEEFFVRYSIFHALICCESSRDFSSEQILSLLGHFQELEDVLEPAYKELMQDFRDLVELTEKSHYKDDILNKINDLDCRWGDRLMYPDRYILIEILTIWKNIAEKEYEEEIPLPDIEAEIKTMHLAFSDQVGFVLSVSNIGAGEARGVHVRLIQTDDYDIVIEKSKTKPLLTSRGRPFEPELVINPKDLKEIIVSYEIRYKDMMGRDAKKNFERSIHFIKEDTKFRKIENPYIIGGIVRDKNMFFGREELLKDIIDNFRGKYQVNPIFLYGQRRTGKTSILYHLREKLRNEFAPVSFDMLEIFGKKSFYEDLMEKIIEKLGFTDIEIPDIEYDPFDLFEDEFYAKIRQRLNGKKIVLMIDEYQRIDELISRGAYDDNVIDFLKALAQDGEINIVLAGSQPPEELQSDKWTGLMRFFTRMNVRFLSREDTVRLICDPVNGFMKYDEGGIERILSLSGGHPYFVQLICHTMVEHHNLNKINLIGYNDVTSHLSKYLDKGENVFFDIILAQKQETERRVLFSLYRLMEEKETVSIHRSEIIGDPIGHDRTIEIHRIEDALSRLERKEIIGRSSEHPDYYEFTIGLYKHWIKWNLP